MIRIRKNRFYRFICLHDQHDRIGTAAYLFNKIGNIAKVFRRNIAELCQLICNCSAAFGSSQQSATVIYILPSFTKFYGFHYTLFCV